MQLRATGDPYDSPTSNVLGQMSAFPNRRYRQPTVGTSVTFAEPDSRPGRSIASTTSCLRKPAAAATPPGWLYDDTPATAACSNRPTPAPRGSYKTDAQMFGRLYGTYTTPGSTYNVTRNYVSQRRHRAAIRQPKRTPGSMPAFRCEICPSCLTTYWRTDFDRNPTTTNGNGDARRRLGRRRRRHVRHDEAHQRRLDCHRRARNSAARRLHDDNDRRSPLPQHERRAATAPWSASTPIVKAASTRRSWSTCSGKPTARKRSRSTAKRPTRRPSSCSPARGSASGLRPLSAHDPAANNRRESANQRRRPRHVHLPNLRADVDDRSIPDAVRRYQLPPNSTTSMCASGRIRAMSGSRCSRLAYSLP